MRAPATIGRYRVLRELGQGHFGVVWLAEGKFVEDGPPRKVAIKQLSGEWSLKRFETLVQEFELLAQVKHPSICRVFEFLDRENAVVLEYVDGVTLRQLLDAFAAAGEKVWPDVVARIGQELADCLFRAHDLKGLVHRDVKPENVMITPKGDIKLLDFGLAVEGEAARRAGGKGTPLYMAPEQARSEAVTHASDLFSLGLVLYELLTGDPAYPIPAEADERSLRALFEAIEAGHVGGVRAMEKAHPELGPVVARCLAPEPRDRWPDGRTLVLALADHARRASLGAFAAFAFEGPLRAARRPEPLVGTMTVGEDSERPMSKNPDPIRPAGAPPAGGGPRPRPQPAARPAAKPAPKMFVPGEKPTSPASTPEKPGAKRPPPGEDLAMVPLGTDDVDVEPAGGGSGATSFFSMPKPKKRATTDGDEPIAPLRRNDPIALAGGGGVASGPVAPPPGAAPAPVGYVPPMTPMQPAPVVPLGIQGPVAGGGMYGAPTPHSAQLPPDLSGDVQRAQSYRVFAVVLGLMFMVFSVLIVTVMIVVGVVLYGNQQQGTKDSQLAVTAPPPPPPPADTGDRVPDPPPVRTDPKPAPAPRGGGGQPSAPKPAAPKPPPPPSSDPAQATIALAPGSPPFTAVEVRCQVSGYRDRADFVGGVAKIPGVPREECDVFFKGGPPAKARIAGGQSKTCSFQGVAANCQ